MSDHDVPDPTSVALGKALTRVRETTARLSDVESELARVRREMAAHDAQVKADALDEAVLPMFQGLTRLAQPHDSKGFSAIGDAYAHAARMARDMLQARAELVRGTGTPTGDN